MGRLIINNAHIQFINWILSEQSLIDYHKYNLNPDMFGPCKDLMERIIDFADKHDGELPSETTVSGWVDEDTFYFCDLINDPEILARELQVRFFYNKSFLPILNRTIDNVELDPEDCMKAMAEFCIKNTEIIYGKVKSYKYQEQAQDQIDLLKDMVTRKDVIIPTGFDEIDSAIGGLRTIKELCVVFARMNQGKSWVACKMAIEGMKSGRKVLYYSGESPVEHVNYRLDTLLFGYPNDKLMLYDFDIDSLDLSEYESKRLCNKEMYSGEIEIITPEDHLNNRKLTVGELRGILQRGHYDYVILDQLSEMEEDGKPSQNTKLKYKRISDELAHLSSEFKTPIVLMCQANRQAGDTGTDENKNTCPELKDIADSDDIARVCTTAISVCQPTKGELLLEVKKARFTGKDCRASYEWNPNLGTFKSTCSGPADNLKPKRPQRQRKEEDVF